MPRASAGLLMYRVRGPQVEVLLVHPGGPYFRDKQDGTWSIPKGEALASEDLLDAARREFEEETSHKPSGPFTPLPAVKQRGGKVVHAWAFAGDCDPSAMVSNTFTLEWPPNSQRYAQFPEIDRAEFMDLETAKHRINPAQAIWIEELEQRLARDSGDRPSPS